MFSSNSNRTIGAVPSSSILIMLSMEMPCVSIGFVTAFGIIAVPSFSADSGNPTESEVQMSPFFSSAAYLTVSQNSTLNAFAFFCSIRMLVSFIFSVLI